LKSVDRYRHRGGSEPVCIRRNVESTADPYLESEQLPENSVCTECGYVYTAGRWCDRQQTPARPPSAPTNGSHPTTCPACRKLRDKLPGGVLRVSGGFVAEHSDEILNLIRNETGKAQAVNPLERLMSLEPVEDGLEITTTNEKLAQRLGRALHKAYSGHIEYKWSESTKLARVNWRRDI